MFNQDLLPRDHQEFLHNLDFKPKVIYDIGSCVMHWTRHALAAFPDSTVICFEAMNEVEFLYKEKKIPLVFGNVLSDVDNESVEFYCNPMDPGGNSVYKENPDLSPRAEELFPEESKVRKTTMTLDTLVNKYQLPRPDLIKMDVQGSELKVLKGAENTLKDCNHLILELQHQNYNMNAPLKEEVIEYLLSKGFIQVKCITESILGVDADYYFRRQ